jgi:hypothetical protein
MLEIETLFINLKTHDSIINSTIVPIAILDISGEQQQKYIVKSANNKSR